MTTSTSAKEQFDRQAAHYNNQWAGWSDETLQRMLALADPQPSWHVLDVATGAGFTALAFAPLVAEVTGADLSPGCSLRRQTGRQSRASPMSPG
jgi:ubiquinone/menaquinone biosynthesis C-methylase UbiE